MKLEYKLIFNIRLFELLIIINFKLVLNFKLKTFLNTKLVFNTFLSNHLVGIFNDSK